MPQWQNHGQMGRQTMYQKSFNILFHKNVFLLYSNYKQMKKIIPALIMLSFVFAACGGDEKAAAEKSKDKYEQTKETLEQTEKKNPKRFLSVEGDERKNLIRQTVVKGTISNKATVASFKDIDVEISFYSETGALLLKDHEVVYKVVGPNSSESFKYKTYAPKGTDSVAMKIVSAKSE